jgi:hypothetical protein
MSRVAPVLLGCQPFPSHSTLFDYLDRVGQAICSDHALASGNHCDMYTDAKMELRTALAGKLRDDRLR